MAFPTVAGTNGGNSGANTTSHTVNLPANIASGDLLIIVFGVDGNPTLTWPSGANDAFTEVFNAANGVACRLGVAYRIANGNEPASVTVTTSVSEGSAHTTYRITGWHGTTPPEVATAATGVSANPDPGSLSPSWGNADTLWLAACVHDVGTRTVSGYPTNYLNGINNRWNNTAGVGVGSAERQLTAASENPGAFTLSGSDDWVATVIGVRPAVESIDRRAHVTWAEFEVPNAPRRALVTWAEMEVPTAPRRALVTWAEFEVPSLGAGAGVSLRRLLLGVGL